MKRILVIGGTGAMGRAVVERLSQNGRWTVDVLTRSPDSSIAKEMEQRFENLTLVQGNLDDEDSLSRAMDDVDAVFCNTNFWSSQSLSKEREQGLRALKIAEEKSVGHFIYSSLDSVANNSGGKLMLPHYDAKAAVEHEIDWHRSDEYMKQKDGGWYSNSVSVLVTAPYFENFQSIFLPEKTKLSNGKEKFVFRSPPIGNAEWQMVALDDIAFFVELMINNKQEWGGLTLRIASEELSMSDIVSTFSKVTGLDAEWKPMSLDEFSNLGLPNSHDVVNNFKLYINKYHSARNYDYLRELHPDLKTWASWLKETGWNGEPKLVQKDAITGSAK